MGIYLRLVRIRPPRRHRAVIRLLSRFMRDDSGGEVLEYALVAGLIVVGAISAISCVGAKVLNRWTSLNAAV